MLASDLQLFSDLDTDALEIKLSWLKSLVKRSQALHWCISHNCSSISCTAVFVTAKHLWMQWQGERIVSESKHAVPGISSKAWLGLEELSIWIRLWIWPKKNCLRHGWSEEIYRAGGKHSSPCLGYSWLISIRNLSLHEHQNPSNSKLSLICNLCWEPNPACYLQEEKQEREKLFMGMSEH